MTLSSSQIKNILIGVLVAYVVTDILLMYATKSQHPGLFSTLAKSIGQQNVLVATLIGLGVGFLAWYAASRTESFSIKKK